MPSARAASSSRLHLRRDRGRHGDPTDARQPAGDGADADPRRGGGHGPGGGRGRRRCGLGSQSFGALGGLLGLLGPAGDLALGLRAGPGQLVDLALGRLLLRLQGGDGVLLLGDGLFGLAHQDQHLGVLAGGLVAGGVGGRELALPFGPGVLGARGEDLGLLGQPDRFVHEQAVVDEHHVEHVQDVGDVGGRAGLGHVQDGQLRRGDARPVHVGVADHGGALVLVDLQLATLGRQVGVGAFRTQSGALGAVLGLVRGQLGRLQHPSRGLELLLHAVGAVPRGGQALLDPPDAVDDPGDARLDLVGLLGQPLRALLGGVGLLLVLLGLLGGRRRRSGRTPPWAARARGRPPPPARSAPSAPPPPSGRSTRVCRS